jgi:hypothetical protein
MARRLELPASLANLPQRRISVPEAAALRGISARTFKRHFSHLIQKTSPRRETVALGDALAIGEQSETAA